MNDVYNFIYKLDIQNKNVVAAISGGPDSMFLLDILINLRSELNFNIIVAHVHHNLRSESDEEAIQVEKYCLDNNIIFEMKKIEKYPNDKFSEESARKIRYEFFDEVIRKYNSDILFTAHHSDDLIETILMRINRGSSLKGYAGFQSISTDRGYIIARPLIYMTKKEIEEYLDSKNIKYAVDMSNKSEKYTRNRYRKYILPELKKENKNLHYKFIEFSEKVLLADQYLKSVSNDMYNKIVIDNEINIIEFNKLDKIIKVYILEKYFKEIYSDNIIQINNKHIEITIKNIKEKSSIIFDLPLNKKAIIEYNKFKVVERELYNKEDYDYIFYESIKLSNGKTIEIDNSTLNTSNYVIHLNSKEIKLPFHVRNRRNGDTMNVKNMLGTKKINDIFTNSKIPKGLRDSYPIVTDDTGKIIWIPGIKKSHLDRKKDENYDIILKYS